MIFDNEQTLKDANLIAATAWLDGNVSTLAHYSNNINISNILDIIPSDDTVLVKSDIDIYIKADFIPYFIEFSSCPSALFYVSDSVIDLNSLAAGEHNKIVLHGRNNADIIWPQEKNITIKTLTISSKFNLNMDISKRIVIDNLSLRNIKSIDYIDVSRYKYIDCDKVSAKSLTKYLMDKQGFKGDFAII